MDGLQVSESENDSDNFSDNRNGLQTSLESSLEYMDVDNKSCSSGSNNDTNGNRTTQRNSLHETNRIVSMTDSGIDLKIPVDNSADNLDEVNADESDDAMSDIENVPHHPSATKRTKQSIKLKIPLSIFKIDLEKVDKEIDKQDPTKIGETKNNTERIAFMIDAASPHPKPKRGRQPNSETNVYVRLAYKGEYKSTNEFGLELYRKFTFQTDVETGEKMKRLQKVRFLYRKTSEVEEIFALPSGSGRSVVMQWADTNFPMSIASAILDEESVTEKEVKNLHENRYLTKIKMKKGESLNKTPEFHLRFTPKIYTKFHADIKSGNDELKKILGFNKVYKVKMQVQLQSILFPKAVIDINKYAEMCVKLSAIYNNPNLPRSRKFDGYLSKVSKNRKAELDKLLLQQLQQFFRLTSGPESDDAFRKLKHYFIVQGDSIKYFDASYYHIYFRGKLKKMFNERPQLQDIHDAVNISTSDFDTFIKRFETLQISTASPSGEKWVKEKLFNCLEGVFYDETAERNYWRVSGEWYQVSGKYSFDVYAEYIQVLETCLLLKEECSLDVFWPLTAKRELPKKGEKKYEFNLEKYRQSRYVLEKVYNDLYFEKPYFVVADNKVTPYGVELCDLLEFIPNPVDKSNTIRLHHVKKAFGADGYRVAICQILCSANYLHDSLKKGDRGNDSSTHRLFEFVKSIQKATVPVYSTYKEFLDVLKNATFVFSPLFESGDRKLDKDYMALLKYDFSDIEDNIDTRFREGLEKELKAFLLDSEYIHAPDGLFTQKWFDACSVPNDRGFHVKNAEGFFVDPFPSKKISNVRQTQLRQLLKQKYYKKVDGLSVKQLIVRCSEELKFMGFGFKICQIEGQGDDLLRE